MLTTIWPGTSCPEHERHQLHRCAQSADGLSDAVIAMLAGVNFYVDDRGSSKGLPVNQRATQIAQLCNRMVTGKQLEDTAYGVLQ